MARTAMIRARTEPALKENAEKVLKELGLTQTEAINMFYHQIVLHHGIPFDVKLPTEATKSAVDELRSGKGEEFASAADLYDSLGI